LASCGFPGVLTLEVTVMRRPAKDGRGHSPARSRASVANALGAPRIHGKLLKLGIDVGQTTVAKYMAKRRRPPSQGWKTFLRNHAGGMASIDLMEGGRMRQATAPPVSLSRVILVRFLLANVRSVCPSCCRIEELVI
jgi:hypothetical protein